MNWPPGGSAIHRHLPKHFGLLLMAFLWAFTGCAQRYGENKGSRGTEVDSRTNAQTHRQPFESLTQYDEVEVQGFLAGMDHRFDSLGFKGIHLGMTCEEVNEVVEKTPWGYLMDRSGKPKPASAEWPNYPQCLPSNFLWGDRSDMGKGWASLGCEETNEPGDCYPLTYMNIKYLDGRLILINLSSPSYPSERIETSLRDWGRFALKVLLRQYGEPDNTVEPIENVGLSSFSTGYEAPLYEWNRGKERIVLYLSEYASTYGCGVILEDVEGLKATTE